MKTKFSKKFSKQFNKAPAHVRLAFAERLGIFMKDQYNPILRNHPLKGRWNNFRSINITGDWRAIFRESKNSQLVFFDNIGTHSELYK